MSAYREAALCLHGLSAVDRDWLLHQLPDEHRRTLNALLLELNSLGIPADPSFSREFASPESKNEGLSLFADNIRIVDNVSAEDICSLLRNEPDALVALIFGMHSWSWEAAVRKYFRKLRHRDIFGTRTAGVSVSCAVVSILANRIQRGDFAATNRNNGIERGWYRRLRGIAWPR